MTTTKSSIPASVLSRLFDSTGSPHLGRGFLLVHTDDKGDVCAIVQSESDGITSLLVNKAMIFADKLSNPDLP